MCVCVFRCVFDLWVIICVANLSFVVGCMCDCTNEFTIRQSLTLFNSFIIQYQKRSRHTPNIQYNTIYTRSSVECGRNVCSGCSKNFSVCFKLCHTSTFKIQIHLSMVHIQQIIVWIRSFPPPFIHFAALFCCLILVSRFVCIYESTSYGNANQMKRARFCNDFHFRIFIWYERPIWKRIWSAEWFERWALKIVECEFGCVCVCVCRWNMRSGNDAWLYFYLLEKRINESTPINFQQIHTIRFSTICLLISHSPFLMPFKIQL